MRRLLTLAILVLMMVLTTMTQAQSAPLRVVATTTQAADAVRIIAGDNVQLTALMGAGVDPHLYQPTEADIAAMNAADLVVFSGLNLEGQFESVLEALGETNIRVLSLGDPVQAAGFTIGGFDLSDEFTDVDDPHFWFDPRNWQISIDELASELVQMDPMNAEIYVENAAAYTEQLELLFEWGQAAFDELPEDLRVIVTSHDAFQYFGDAFGLEVAAIQGLSTEDEAGVGDVQDIVNFVVERQIPVLFVESSVPPNTIQAVQEAAAAQGLNVGIGVRELYSDAMGEPDSFGGTYVGMLAENIITILQSYDADVPEFPEGLMPRIPQDLLSSN